MEQKQRKPSKFGSYFHSDKFVPSKLSKYFWSLSLTILFVGIILLCTLGFNLGLDFTGGNVMEVKAGEQLEQTTTYNSVQNTIKDVLNANGASLARIQKVGQNDELSIQFQYQNIAGKTTEEMTTINEQIRLDLVAELNTLLPSDSFTVQAAETKSASASSSLLFNSLVALAIAIVAILVYIAIRFELLSGLAAVITLFHDVLLMCALVLIFRIEINSAFIAAIITILGYSVNNTIVVFDRVRENLKKETLAGKTNTEIADISIKQTLTRTFNTSLTTLLAVVMLAVIGVSAIREFIIPIIFGLLVGTYAAIFISAPLWAKIITNSRFDRKKIGANKSKKQDNEKVIEVTAQPVN